MGFPCASENHEVMGLASGHMVDHALQSGKIQLPFGIERGDEGHPQARESLGHFKSSVFK